ncbi:MAG TPA: hypothetical protein VG056_15925, partial [Pirellulales bacterium]|nr:hypothetical protein [Pirellulales bacterium]
MSHTPRVLDSRSQGNGNEKEGRQEDRSIAEEGHEESQAIVEEGPGQKAGAVAQEGCPQEEVDRARP